MLRSLYRFLKKLPLVGAIIERIRLASYHWVSRVADESVQPVQEQFHRLAESVYHRFDAVEEKTTALGERLEYSRLELFFELMHRLQQGAVGDRDPEEVPPVILNEASVEQAKASGAIRLNIGCGHKPIDGYLNVDQRSLPQVDIQAQALNLPVEAGSVEKIHAAHLVEHFTLENLRRRVLPYWRDCLKPGGRLHLVAPNADAMIKAYSQQELPFDQLATVLLGMQEYEGDFHYSLLSPESLKRLLQEVGFQDIDVLVADRVNGLCREMELTARKPVVN